MIRTDREKVAVGASRTDAGESTRFAAHSAKPHGQMVCKYGC